MLVLAGIRCVSAWLSHRLETVTLRLEGTFVSRKALDTDKRLLILRTSVSVLMFSYFSVFQLHVVGWVPQFNAVYKITRKTT